LVADEENLEETTYQTRDLDYASTYYWRVQASNEAGESDWSEIRSFTTMNEPVEPPATPLLASPEDGTINISINPSLEWNNTASAGFYRIQIALDEGFNSTVLDREGISATSFDAEGLDFNTLYYWRVQAVNEAGTSNWSNARSFTTEEQYVEAPQPQSPPDGAGDQPTTITLEWSEVLLANEYQVQLSTDEDFDGIIEDETTASTSHQISGLEFETTYYWRVRSITAVSTSSWSEVSSFTTIDETPAVPVLASPPDNATGLPNDPVFEWTEGDRADSYRLQVATGENFNELIADEDGIEATTHQVGELDFETTYYWRVQASNNAGTSDWSDAWSFTTGDDPGQPQIAIISPSTGEIWMGNATHTIAWETDESISTVDIAYSVDNGSSWNSIAESVSAASESYGWPVPDISSMNTRIRITDSADEETEALSGRFYIYPESIRVTASYSFSDTPAASDYRLIGLPAGSHLNISQLLTGTHGVTWNVYHDDGSDTDYMIEYDGSDTFNLNPGRAFWVISREPVQFESEFEAVPLADDTTYAISIQPGWNIISNPFTEAIAWSDVQVKNNVNEPIWGFEGSFDQSDAFEPFTGYYFYNENDLEELRIPYATDQSGSVQESGMPADELFSLSVSTDGVIRSSVQLGFDSGNGKIREQTRYKAPPGDFLDAYLTLTEKEASQIEKGDSHTRKIHYASDIRHYDGQKQEYRLQLKSSGKYPVKFKVEGLQHIGEKEIYLVSNQTGKFYDLRRGTPVLSDPDDGIRSYTLLIGSVQDIEDSRDQFQPEIFTLEQNYPNPFNAQTVFEYSIPGTYSNEPVRLEIYDVQGRRVQTLVNERQQAGFYTVRWDAGNLASGVYFYRLRVGPHVKTMKMTLLK
jgi:hypothetical protein